MNEESIRLQSGINDPWFGNKAVDLISEYTVVCPLCTAQSL